MKGFLEQTASYLHRVYGDELHTFCIVFPNVRAGLFFRKYLAQLCGKPVWAPSFRTLDSLMEEMTGLTAADRLSLIFDLYQAYRQHKPTAESFEEFYFWGEMLLDDFDDVDKHLVDARDLFRNVSDLKEIDLLFDYLTADQKNAIRLFWQDFNGGSSGSLKTEFAAIWPSLFPIYETFRKRLKKKRTGYGGMIQREAVRLLRSGNAAHAPFGKYVFVGFNALTECETYFFKSLRKQGRAMFFWDYDDYYLANEWHEAGVFMRKNMRSFPPEQNFDSRNLADTSKDIEIISVPSETGQAAMAGRILAQAGAGADWSRVAVVLADEHLLLPALSSIPAQIRDVNITMGYPFACSPVNSLFERLASLQQHVRMYPDGARFYHRDVCMILYHPCIQDIAPEEAARAVKHITGHNRIYVPAAEIPEHRLLQLIFTRCTQAQEFMEYLLAITSEIVAALLPEPQKEDGGGSANGENGGLPLQLEYLYTFYTALQRMRDVLAADKIVMDIRVSSRLLRKILASLRIPFSGEPLKGLQVMGMLETRALDFDRVIVLSMNEGIFPKGSARQSFIPYNLRKGFGLITSERHDAMSAYHFYRLIQRASKVSLIYNSAATDRNTGEMSRFTSQLVYEPVFSVRQRNITFNVNTGRSKPVVKERTGDVRRILGLYLAESGDMRKLSPSALNSYLDCRLRFYFRYVDELKETDTVADEVDQSVFGNLLHKSMELIYSPYREREITSGTIARLQADRHCINQALLRAFADEYFHSERVTDSDITGRNVIIREVLLKYIMRILEVDKAATPFTILALEDRLDARIPLHSGTLHAALNMRGYIDRLDDTGGALRIIDYKTGNAQRGFTGIPDLFDRSKTGNHAVMQTLTYACMVHVGYRQYQTITSCLYVMKDLFRDNFDPRIHISRKQPVDNYFDISDEFQAELNRLLSEIFLSDTPFTQTEDTGKCLTCPYADICHRKRR